MITREESIYLGFGDADPAGAVFYPRAFALAHQTVENLLRQSEVGWENWFASAKHAAPLRRAEADFFLPLRPGASVVTRAAVEKIGTTSVTFRVDLFESTGRLAATIRTTHVMIDKATGRATPLSRELSAALHG
jgi:acyl-CoA thioesterase FadM